MARVTKPPQKPATDAERVQKILARAGLASRREAEDWIRAGRVTINGAIATLGSKAQGSDQLRLDGRLIHKAPASRAATWICHRSSGENLVKPDAETDVAVDGRNAVSQRLSRRVGRRYIAVSPMPRIDGGMELLTSDGALAARLQRAMRAMPLEFSLRIRGELIPDQLAGIMEGALDSGERMQITSCEPTGGESSNRWYKVMAVGANGRDLRSLVERQGATVSRILRVAMGGLKLERTLARGQVRQLDDNEIDALLQVDLPPTDNPATDQ
ncbi:MAG: S4 domain-containing protein [Steroidobacteraceae bacterium]